MAADAETQTKPDKEPIGPALLVCRIIVGVAFLGFAAAFLAETVFLFHEFGYRRGLAMATFDSHNFVFFPTLGVVALLAFWRSTAMLLEDAWINGVKGMSIAVLVAVGSTAACVYLAGVFSQDDAKSWWEMAPAQHDADTGTPSECLPPACDRAPVEEAFYAVRAAAVSPDGLRPYAFGCGAAAGTAFAPRSETGDVFCFATGHSMSPLECCQARADFRAAVARFSADDPSDVARVHRKILPVKVFFLLTLFIIGVALVSRAKALSTRYPERAREAEAALPIGALAMLAWPVMNFAYAQNLELLYGGERTVFVALEPLFTLLFAAWALSIVFYYFRRYRPSVAAAARTIGGLAAVVGLIQFDAIVAFTTRYAGAGADLMSLISLGVISMFLAGQAVAALSGEGGDASDAMISAANADSD